jgi:hypothetical protein
VLIGVIASERMRKMIAVRPDRIVAAWIGLKVKLPVDQATIMMINGNQPAM